MVQGQIFVTLFKMLVVGFLLISPSAAFRSYAAYVIAKFPKRPTKPLNKRTAGTNMLMAPDLLINKLFQLPRTLLPKGARTKSDHTIPSINTTIAIIGAGIAGLSCATELRDAGITDFKVVESSDGVGGRVRSDDVKGYRLDRGFQVFIDSYPEVQDIFNFDCLSLRKFQPGALVRSEGQFHLVSDPFRRPGDLLESLESPIGNFFDKVKVGLLSVLIRLDSIEDILTRPEKTTADYLANEKGLSDSMIKKFFTPFYQGIFLAPLSEQSSRMFEFVFKMFTVGSATLPAAGIGAVSKKLASRLSPESVLLNSKVAGIDWLPAYPSALTTQASASASVSILETNASHRDSPLTAKLSLRDRAGSYLLHVTNTTTGEAFQIKCEQIVVAADPLAARRLLATLPRRLQGSNQSPSTAGASPPQQHQQQSVADPAELRQGQGQGPACIDVPAGRGSTCIYFGFDGPPPIKDSMLVLNGDIESEIPVEESSSFTPKRVPFRPVVNNVCFPSQLSRQYAPAGKSLASVTIIGTDCHLPSATERLQAATSADDVQIADHDSGARRAAGIPSATGIGTGADAVGLPKRTTRYSDEELSALVLDQLAGWWGPRVRTWELLRIYRIPYAQPAQMFPAVANSCDGVTGTGTCVGSGDSYLKGLPVQLGGPRKSQQQQQQQQQQQKLDFEGNVDDAADSSSMGIYCIGDHRDSPTLNGAIRSGRRAAALIAREWQSDLNQKQGSY